MDMLPIDSRIIKQEEGMFSGKTFRYEKKKYVIEGKALPGYYIATRIGFLGIKKREAYLISIESLNNILKTNLEKEKLA